MNPPKDIQLLQRCKAGDPQAFETLVERYQHTVFRLALSILEDPTEAAEVTHDSFVRAIHRLSSYRGKPALKTWLFAITTSWSRNRLRKRQRRERLENLTNRFFQASCPVPLLNEENDPQVARSHEIHLAVKLIEEKYRLPLILRYYHDLTIVEIAQVLGVSERTIHQRLCTAHLALMTQLESIER